MRKQVSPLKLDLSYGPVIQPGFTRRKTSVFPDSSVEEIWCQFLFNRITNDRRVAFMDECYRVLKPGGKMTVIVPYWSSLRSVQDFGHAWPPVHEAAFQYFNKQWRTVQQLAAGDSAVSEWLEYNPSYQMKCDFDILGFGYIFDPETQMRSEDVRSSWMKSRLNAASDLQIVLQARK